VSAGRRSVLLIVAALAVIAALWAWLGQLQSPADPRPAPVGSQQEVAAPPGAPGFTATTEAPVEPLLDENTAPDDVDGDAAAATPDPPSAPAVDESLPIVARGRVDCLSGLERLGGEALLVDVGRRTLAQTKLDEQGRFELRWGQPLLAGWRVRVEDVLIRSENVFRSGSVAATRPLPAHWPGQPPQECSLVVGLPPVLTGVVRSAGDGLPIPGAEVEIGPAYGPPGKDRRSARTDGEGRYHHPLRDMPLEDLVIAAMAEGFQAGVVGVLSFEPVDRFDGLVSQDVELGAPQRLRGRVVDAATGAPLPGARLYLDSHLTVGRWDAGWVGVDGTGRFEIDATRIVVSSAWLAATAPGHGPALLIGPEPWGQLELRLGEPAVLVGRVTDVASGLPIEAASLTVRQPRELGWGAVLADSGRSDAEGVFTMHLENVPPEYGLVQVVAGGYAPWEGWLTEAELRGPGRWELHVLLGRLPNP
jgi:hypothetical protein